MQWKIIFWILILAWLWGPSSLFIKISSLSVPPLAISTIRTGIAALILIIIILAKRHSFIPKERQTWKHLTVMALLGSILPFSLVALGSQYIESSLVAIFMGTIPIFTVVIAHFTIADERLSYGKLMGVMISFCGILLIFFPKMKGEMGNALLGMTWVMGATLSLASSMVYAKKKIQKLPPLLAPMVQFMIATAITLPLSLYFEKPLSLPWPPMDAIISLLILGVFGTALAFVVYYKIIDSGGATATSLAHFFSPFIGTVLGTILLGEILSWHCYMGCALLFLGLLIVREMINWKFFQLKIHSYLTFKN